MVALRRGSQGAALLLLLTLWATQSEAAQDLWQLVVANAGVSSMHCALMHTNRVVCYDRTDFGPSPLIFPDGYCRNNPRDKKLVKDCTAHSISIDIATNKVKPLKIFSDTWCSSASFKADGTLLSTGGWNDGGNVIRTIGAGANDDWKEFPNAPNALVSARWYASNAILPDNRVIIVGGRRAFSYEFSPRAKNEGQYKLDFLYATNQPGVENNLYPMVFLCPDGNVFIMANQDSILLNYKKNTVVRKYPKIPGGPRSYPASCGMLALPLTGADGYKQVEVLVCGGTTATASMNTGKGIFETALDSCGRMVITSAAPKWTMSTMPTPRVMGDMVNLPNGEVLIINGARKGAAGWKVAYDPVFTPVTYNPGKNRFFTWSATTIPRLYHSVAVVLPDGKILVAGSNPHTGYDFKPKAYPYPTELRIEKYSPFYLNKGFDLRRPKIAAAPALLKYNVVFKVTFTVGQAPVGVVVIMYAPPFVTHTYSQNQRMLILKQASVTGPVAKAYTVTVTSPPSSVIAPAGYYLLNIVNQGTPSPAVWTKIG